MKQGLLQLLRIHIQQREARLQIDHWGDLLLSQMARDQGQTPADHVREVRPHQSGRGWASKVSELAEEVRTPLGLAFDDL
jgi:hypothetical protein